MIPHEVVDRFLSMAHIWHLMHDTIYRLDECQHIICKQNVSVMHQYHLHVPEAP